MAQSDNRQSDNPSMSLISRAIPAVSPLIANQPGGWALHLRWSGPATGADDRPGRQAPRRRRGGRAPRGGGFARPQPSLCPRLRAFHPSGGFRRGYTRGAGLGAGA